MLKKTANSCPLINGDRVHCLDTGRKGGYLATTLSHRARPSATRPTTRSNEGLGRKHLHTGHPTRLDHCAWGGGSESGVSDGVGDIISSLKGDNPGSIALAHNPVFHSRTKHIDIQHHYIGDEVASQRIQLSYVPTEKMIADGLTKALTQVKFHRFIEQMNMT